MTTTELKPDEAELIEQARIFTQEHVAPHAEAWEHERIMPLETLQRAAARFGGMLVPEHYGGLDVSFTTAARVLEEIAKVDMAFAFSLVVQMNMTTSIAKAGTDDHRARFLPDLLAGRRICSFCLTESVAGTDVASIATRARRDSSGWLLEGEKAWVTNGAVADFFCVFAQSSGESGPKNIAAFFVVGPKRGVIRLPMYELMSGHAMGTAGLKLEGCRVPDEDVFHGPGDGFKAAMQGIDLARILLSAMCCGMLENGLDTALVYAGNRHAFGRPIADFQALQFEFAEVATQLEAARRLSYHAAGLLDRGESATLAAAHAKKFATRAAFDGLGRLMQMMGANGYRRNYPLARQLGNAKMAHYLDGTTEVQNVVIGRALARPAAAK